MNSRALYQVIAVIVLGTSTACATQRSWVYKPAPGRDAAALVDKTAVVPPFEDARENANRNRMFVGLIPILPGFGWLDYQVPEGAQIHLTSGLWTNYQPTEDFAKALAAELESGRIFRESFFGYRKEEGDYVIKGRILDTRYRGTQISYGLSAYGSLLWFFGLPVGNVTNTLSVELSCAETGTGRVILAKTYSAPKYSKMSWIYVPADDFNYPNMLSGVYRKFVEDLKFAMIDATQH